MHSLTNILMPGVQKAGFLKSGRLVVEGQFGQNGRKLHENYITRILGSI